MPGTIAIAGHLLENVQDFVLVESIATGSVTNTNRWVDLEISSFERFKKTFGQEVIRAWNWI